MLATARLQDLFNGKLPQHQQREDKDSGEIKYNV